MPRLDQKDEIKVYKEIGSNRRKKKGLRLSDVGRGG